MNAQQRAALPELARVFLRLGSTAFGGPAAHTALLHQELVLQRQWLSGDQFLDLVSAASLIPGPNSTELVIHIGLQRAGYAGMLVAGLSFIAPAMLSVLLLAASYVRFGSLPAALALLGVRNLDSGEHALLQSAGVAVYDMAHIDRFGMAASVEAALAHVLKNCAGLYLSLDMDALDPLYAPGVGTPVPGGLSYREAHLACELVAARGCLLAMDVVEVNPVLDEHNRTAQVAVDLVLSALGKRVWEPA